MGELEDSVTRLREELAAARNALAAHREAALDAEASGLATSASRHNGLATVQRAWDQRPVEELRGLALRLTSARQTLVLLGTAGEKAQLVLARSEELALDLRPALQAALAALGGGKGGGARVVQGGGPPADLARVQAALVAARVTLGL